MEEQANNERMLAVFAGLGFDEAAQESLRRRIELTGSRRGFYEGRLEARREVLFRLIARSGFKLAEHDRARLARCDDAKTLDYWVDYVAQQGRQRAAERQVFERDFREGKLDGLRGTLLRLLARAGITLTEDDRARIQACDDAATLDRWVENVLVAKTAADVLS